MTTKSFFGFRHALVLTLGACLGLAGCAVDASNGGEETGDGQEPNTGADALTVQRCGQWDTVDVAGKKYVVQNNRWGNYTSQCLTVDPSSGKFSISAIDQTTLGISGYPSIFKGCHYGNCTDNSGMPKQVNAIHSVPSTWSVFPPNAGSYESAYDLWFNKTPTSAGQNDGAEIMVWTDKRNTDGDFQPVGTKIASVTLNGEGWDVWYGQLNNGPTWNVITYVHQQPRTFGVWYNVKYDLNQFIKDAKNRHLVDGTWYLTSVQAGFEPRHNGKGLQSANFTATVQ